MTTGSFDFPPCDGKVIHQRIDQLAGILIRTGGEMGITGGGQNAVMAEDFLDFEQVDAGFDQMGCIAVPKAVRGAIFFLDRTVPLPCAESSARRRDPRGW
jgi:hypothetical protein